MAYLNGPIASPSRTYNLKLYLSDKFMPHITFYCQAPVKLHRSIDLTYIAASMHAQVVVPIM
jgi:hypothetical protein